MTKPCTHHWVNQRLYHHHKRPKYPLYLEAGDETQDMIPTEYDQWELFRCVKCGSHTRMCNDSQDAGLKRKKP